MFVIRGLTVVRDKRTYVSVLNKDKTLVKEIF